MCLIRQVRPQRIITWSPEWNWQRFRSCHPDHRATGEIALSAIYPDAGNPFAYLSLREEEGLEAWTVQEAWLINSPQVNHYVDVTEIFELKVAAVRLHQSPDGQPAGSGSGAAVTDRPEHGGCTALERSVGGSISSCGHRIAGTLRRHALRAARSSRACWTKSVAAVEPHPSIARTRPASSLCTRLE